MFIYLHGFNSSGQSAKGEYFKARLAPTPVLTPTYCADPDNAITQLSEFIASTISATPDACLPVLIGSSLGGYYAQCLARKFSLAVVMINPALQPAQTLRPYLGWQTNFYTGEKYYFGEPQLENLLAFDIPEPCAQPVPTLVLLDKGDEVIDYRVASAIYSTCATVIVYPGGNHGFEHLAEAAQEIHDFSQGISTKRP